MTDDLDHRLRAAMKQLDDDVPSGYFDALSERVLARLGGTETDMQTGVDPSRGKPAASVQAITAGAAAPPATPEPVADESSGLHEIRDLARNTRERMSSRRITAQPFVDEDVLASSSAGWKAVALPEPAKLVSLPELGELPRKAARGGGAARRHTGRNAMLAAIGVAAAAGIVFVATSMTSSGSKSADDSAPVSPPVAAAVSPPVVDKQVAAPATPPAPAAPAPTPPVATTETPAPPVAIEPKPMPPVVSPAISKMPSKKKPAPSAPVVTKQVATKPAPPTQAMTKGKQAEPSLDDLLNEDKDKTVKSPAQQDVKPKLDKKALDQGDINAAMGALTKQAQSCFKGTQGSAVVKASVAPSGRVTKVTVTGMFAGKPEATCVIAVVQNATFPPWDGGPQTVTYPYFLSE